jgi:tight adherence protein C
MSELTAQLASPLALIPLAFAISCFIAVYALSSAAAVKRERMARVRAAAARRGRSQVQRRGPAAGDDLMALIKRLVERVNIMRDRRGAALSVKLAQAGWRSNDAVTLYLFGKLVLPAVAAGVAALYLFLAYAGELETMFKLGGVILAALIGSNIPELVVKNQTQKRAKEIQKALPDALDLMVICAESGLSLDASFKRVASEIKPASPALADEFGLTLLELRFMPERRVSLENLAKRCPLQGVTALVNTLFQTEKFGTPLAQALRVLAGEMRETRMLRAEEKAARLPAIMTVPLIMFILPALFVVLLGPAVMDIGDMFRNMK